MNLDLMNSRLWRPYSVSACQLTSRINNAMPSADASAAALVGFSARGAGPFGRYHSLEWTRGTDILIGRDSRRQFWPRW